MNLNAITDNFFRRLQQIDGRAVSYIRGERFVGLRAVVDSASMENFSDTIGKRQTLNFAFLTAELKIGNEFITPQRGDVILHEGDRFEVIEGNNGCDYNFEESGKRIVSVMAQRIRKEQNV